MKALHTIAALIIANNFSLYSMNIVQHQKLHKFTIKPILNHQIRRSSCMKDSFIKNIKEKMPNINVFANIGNVISASMMTNPMYLLPMIPQTLQIISDRLYSSRNPTQCSQDLACLINNDPYFLRDLEVLKKLTLLKENKINHKVSLSKNEITELEEELTKIKSNLIEKASPLLNKYNEIEISEFLRNYKELLKLKKWHAICMGTSLYGMVLVPIALAATCPEVITETEEYAITALLCCNTIIAAKNISTSYRRLNQADDHYYYRDIFNPLTLSPNDAIQILEIYKAHMQIENNKLNQTNE
jgi:hypothetical protein